MDKWTKALRGSPTRDRFKLLHKQMMPSHCYAFDCDLVLVEKYPFAFIVALLDFKIKGFDSITFAEAIGYKRALDAPPPYHYPVYIIEGNDDFRDEDNDPDTHRFDVFHLTDTNYLAVLARV